LKLGGINMKSLEELKAIRDRMQGQVGFRAADASETRVVVGMATCGIASGAKPVLNAIADGVKAKGLGNIKVTQTGCIGLCQYEPIVEVYEPGKGKVTYVKMNAEKANEVVEKHLAGGNVVTEYTIDSITK
jgi:NADP-reducing hydrogenase subunit HndB